MSEVTLDFAWFALRPTIGPDPVPKVPNIGYYVLSLRVPSAGVGALDDSMTDLF